MKKLLLLAAAALIGFGSASAKDITVEIDSSKIYVGGSVGVWYDTDSKTTTAHILPEVGYNINNTWSVGTQIGYSYAKENSSFVFNPYARWTFLHAGMAQLFVDGGVGFQLGSYNGLTSAAFKVGFKPGVALNVHKHISVVAHLGFLGYSGGNKYATDVKKGVGFDFSNALSFGFYYNF